MTTRRAFLASLPAVAAPVAIAKDLDGEVGVTTASFSGHVAVKPAAGQIALMDLPRFMRDSLDMRVLDLNTNTLESLEPAHLDKFRAAAEKAGCPLTNLKMNQPKLDMNSTDPAVRKHALDEYKAAIRAAARLGCRWARPLPLPARPDMKIHLASYRELADFAAQNKVQMVVENYGWMESDIDSVPAVIKGVGKNIAAAPDTGNWDNNEHRYAGLAKCFPLAVTCDFKTRKLGPMGEHPEYDLRRCFDIGWKAGFKGPWCMEILDKDRTVVMRELAQVRDWLRQWMKA